MLIRILLLCLLLSGCQREDQFSSLRTSEWLIVNYWATWCAPCREEIPELNALAKSDPYRVAVAGVNFDEKSPEKHAEDVLEMGIEFNTLSHAEAQQLGLSKPQVLPTTFLFQRGELKHQLHGPQTQDSIEKYLAQ